MSPLDAFSQGGLDAVGQFGLDARGLTAEPPGPRDIAIFVSHIDEADHTYFNTDGPNYYQSDYDNLVELHDGIIQRYNEGVLIPHVYPYFGVIDYPVFLEPDEEDRIGDGPPFVTVINAAQPTANYVVWDVDEGLSYLSRIAGTNIRDSSSVDLKRVGMFLDTSGSMTGLQFHPIVDELHDALLKFHPGMSWDVRNGQRESWLLWLAELARPYYQGF